MNEYKVKILKPNNWRKYPVGRLDISVGMPNHEDRKFSATMAWAQRRFKHVIVSVADTLQRHNYMAEGMDQETAYTHSYDAGTAWIERHQEHLQNATVIRWDQRLTHPLYMQYMKRTLDHLMENPLFQQSLQDEALGYTARKGLAMTEDRINYLLEEIAVFDLLFKIEPAADVYPGSILPFWEHDIYKPKAAFTRIDFTRKIAA
ncbi:MAG: tRNA-dependent cyclodipeptide synthase [Rhodospirillales bacterium]|nr:tRNA-dependent cyclodipeptide synthase [Rhodospirillales bacterium]